MQSPKLNGQDAFTDATGVGATPTLSWSKPTVGSAAFYTVTITHLHLVNSRPRRDVMATLHTAGTSVRIPSDVLQSGESYVFTLTARAGLSR